MNSTNKNEIVYDQEREKYIPKDLDSNLTYKKMKKARLMLFFSPIVHIGTCVIFLILLLINWVIGDKLGFTFTALQFGLAIGYIALAILVDLLVFMLPANKARKKTHFRIMIVSTLIFATLILSGSLAFWGVPVLLFYSLITLIIWLIEVYIAVLLISIVESLPN